MKGLLIKDIRLMKNMKNSLLMIILIAVAMSSYLQDLSFLVVYMSLIGATFTTSTLSYDEFDKGLSFLLSLPVTRKHYVMEKYLLGLILGGGGWLFGAVLSIVSGTVRNIVPLTDGILVALMGLPTALLLISILLPFHLKFGGEKGRVIMVVAMGLLFGILVGAAKIAEYMNIDLNGMFDNLSALGSGAVAAAAVTIGVVILLLSLRVSIGIMEKKEF